MTTFRTACALLAAFAVALSALIASPRPAGGMQLPENPFLRILGQCGRRLHRTAGAKN